MTRADLIARLEAASEGSREMDGMIAFYCLGWRQRFGGDENEYSPEWEHLGGHWLAPGQADTNITHREPPGGFQEPPAYTTSLDAALTLVPKGWRTTIGDYSFGWTAALYSPDFQGKSVPGQGGEEYVTIAGRTALGIQKPTPALALVIAALKAGCDHAG